MFERGLRVPRLVTGKARDNLERVVVGQVVRGPSSWKNVTVPGAVRVGMAPSENSQQSGRKGNQ